MTQNPSRVPTHRLNLLAVAALAFAGQAALAQGNGATPPAAPASAAAAPAA
ncbi:formate dehydrogenase subunit gamma, partial [Mitsuaria sp. WAJ17]|nr:formate dehydrogenase subunit gamma [Mitsuaria sp. WAJ17]